MTDTGGREDARPEFPPHMMRMETDESGGSYRQDDAPTGAESSTSHSGLNAFDDGGKAKREIDQILALLASTPKEFARLVDGQSDEVLGKPGSDGEWGVVEILPHMRDWEEVYLEWIRNLLNEDTPTLEVVDDSLWSIEHDYTNEHVPDVLGRFSELRAEVLRVLESVEDADWQRRAVHPQLGRINLHQLADRMCDHDAKHLQQARDALA